MFLFGHHLAKDTTYDLHTIRFDDNVSHMDGVDYARVSFDLVQRIKKRSL